MRIYLDSNVIIDVCDGRLPELSALLLRAVDGGKHSFPFTAEQISEVTFGDDVERSKARLQFLSQLSRDQYFADSVQDLGFRTESPFSVWSTLNGAVLAPGTVHDIANFVSYDQLRQAREQLGLDSRKLNNMSPRGAIDCIESIFAPIDAPTDMVVPRSLSDFLSFIIGNHREHFSDLWRQMEASPDRMLVDKTIVILFSLFDSFGFWPDDRVTYEKGSRFADGKHAFNASNFDVFVSRDRRLLNKSAAVYEYLGLQVSVQTTEAFERELNQQLAEG